MVNNRIAYAEVYEILRNMDKAVVMKIPIEILNVFKNQRDINYISRIDSKDLFNPDNVEKKTRDIIAWLDLEYWATAEEKKELIAKYRKNEFIAEQKKKEEYESKYNQIFIEDKEDVMAVENISTESDKQICIIKNNWFEKIKSFFKKMMNNY